MNTITASFFGHRDFNEHLQYEDKLDEIIDDIMQENEWVEFLVGRNGEFDIFSASAVVRARKKVGNSRCYLNLILPYVTHELKKNENYFLDYYDNIEICLKKRQEGYKSF